MTRQERHLFPLSLQYSTQSNPILFSKFILASSPLPWRPSQHTTTKALRPPRLLTLQNPLDTSTADFRRTMAVKKPNAVNVIDIRRSKLDESLLRLMLEGLRPSDPTQRTMPTLLLYDGTFKMPCLVQGLPSYRAWPQTFRKDHLSPRILPHQCRDRGPRDSRQQDCGAHPPRLSNGRAGKWVGLICVGSRYHLVVGIQTTLLPGKRAAF